MNINKYKSILNKVTNNLLNNSVSDNILIFSIINMI